MATKLETAIKSIEKDLKAIATKVGKFANEVTGLAKAKPAKKAPAKKKAAPKKKAAAKKAPAKKATAKKTTAKKPKARRKGK